MMKLILYENAIVDDVITGIENFTSEKNNLYWENGSILGLKLKWILRDDNFSINIGDTIDLNETDNLNEIKQQKINALKGDCKNAIFLPFVSQTTGHSYDFELKDQLNFSMQYSWLQSHPTDTSLIKWPTNDAGEIMHTREEFLGVCADAKEHIMGYKNKYWVLKDEVNAATTSKEVFDISWG